MNKQILKMTYVFVCLLLVAIPPRIVTGQDSDAQKTGEPKPLELPECDIFLFDISEDEAGEIKISNGINTTNRPGYDNQPFFTPDSSSFLYSANADPFRTDVFEYVIESKTIKQITDSPNQEYSPQISPDNQTLSFVTDGATANQSVWAVERDGSSEKWLLANQGEREPVGYYSWNHKTGYILFWSRYGFNVRLVHESKDLSHYVTGDAVPSTPHIIPDTNFFSFLHRQGNGQVWIKQLDPDTHAILPLTATVGPNNNYCWTPSRKILMCDDTKLHSFDAQSAPSASGESKTWKLVEDLANHGLKSATRVAVSPDGTKLAVVGVPK